mmetsp:Transcript_5372/g.9445  ORF Transcript_5372/g.9445 Transcript_5372/m.9445 type:complete len:164 (+) Transcript_5372:2148-2639(+)
MEVSGGGEDNTVDVLSDARKSSSEEMLSLEVALTQAIGSCGMLLGELTSIPDPNAQKSASDGGEQNATNTGQPQEVSRDQVCDLVATLDENLHHVVAKSEKVSKDEGYLPFEILQAIDSGINPQFTTLCMLEDMVDLDANVRGKELSMDAFYRRLLKTTSNPE